MAIADKVRKIVAEQLDVSIDKVTDDARFIEDLGADSLAVVEIVLAFETEFELEIPDEVTAEMRTIGDVLDYVTKHVKHAA
jgi:acyl carrier protein